MSETSVLSLILGILTLAGGSGGLLAWQKYRKESPVTKRDADIAVAKSNVEAAGDTVAMAISIAKAAKEHSEGLGVALATVTARVETLETHVKEQDKTIRLLRDAVRIFGAAWDDLVFKWHEYRLHEQPPPRPHVRTD